MKKNIVLVEDSNFVRSTLRHALSKIGYEVHEFVSGEDVLRAKKFNPSVSTPGLLDQIMPDLFIIDVGLENISGIDVLKRLKEHADFKNVPVVVNSSHTDKNTIISAVSAGASDYVIKEDNYVELLIQKVNKFFEKELNTFETTLQHELEWIKFGNKELSLALVVVRQKGEKSKNVDEDCYQKIIAKLKEKLRNYDWIFPLDEKTIALILPLSSVQGIVIVRRRVLEELLEFANALNMALDVQIGFSHFPTNASDAKELLSIAKGQIK
jgi:DNA-binding response OmpR family regulator